MAIMTTMTGSVSDTTDDDVDDGLLELAFFELMLAFRFEDDEDDDVGVALVEKPSIWMEALLPSPLSVSSNKLLFVV
jgi:hypothetical protein